MSEEVVVTARKWGNSIGFTLSKEVAEKEHIRPKDKVVISLKKAKPIEELFGTLKTKKSGQEIKDEMRKGWN